MARLLSGSLDGGKPLNVEASEINIGGALNHQLACGVCGRYGMG
jgi:hypothetical protein